MAEPKDGAQPAGEIRLTPDALRTLITEAVRAATSAGSIQIEDSEADFLASIQKFDPNERETALRNYMETMTPQQQIKRRQTILAAYAALAPAPTAKDGLRPGTYIEVGKDSGGAPIRQKVRYTREWIEANYPMVRITPIKTTKVIFSGIQWQLHGGEPIEVPSIIADIYEDHIRAERGNVGRYRPLMSADSDAAINALFGEGQKYHISRVFKAGGGMMGTPAEDFAQENSGAVLKSATQA